MYTKDMVEVRIHGRGGQGAVLAASLAAEVAFRSGYYPQAFPFFGAEKRGAPVAAFLRYSSSLLMPRCRIYEPFCVVLFDTKSLPPEIVLDGLKEKGKLLLNTAGENVSYWRKAAGERKLYVVDASHIAVDCGLISSGMPLVSSVMLGALVKILDLTSLEVLQETLQGKISQFEKENIECARQGYEEVKEVFQDAVF
ncbi:MAG: 2-oxoacid:acceptor oxidoreductase family protein [Bacillota bacterium]|nr:2-oxoacid:acceptor oxidoreductase family protein [Bacillota bacterium]